MKKWILLLGILTADYALAAPIACPDVHKIQMVGLSSRLARDNNGKWYAGRTSQFYGTPDKWTFVIGDISAPTKQKAILEANEALSTLSYRAGPMPAPSNKWLCLYDNDEGLPSGAVSPPISPVLALKSIS